MAHERSRACGAKERERVARKRECVAREMSQEEYVRVQRAGAGACTCESFMTGIIAFALAMEVYVL